MPELPEVETVTRTLAPRLVGRMVTQVRLHRQDILTPTDTDFVRHVTGRTITAIHRRAKRIVFTLDNAQAFYIHLGMTGQLTLENADAPLKPHTHLVLELHPKPQTPYPHLRFRDPRRFGGVFWLGQSPCDEQLGPEPLTLRPERLHKLLRQTRRAIKVALLDQRLIAGIGNIYADEALFAARIHPLTPANVVTPAQSARLNRALKLTLRNAIKARGSTLRDYVDADNAPGEYRNQHKVYNRAGEKCPACKTLIQRIVLGGRSTCFCPKCQRIS